MKQQVFTFSHPFKLKLNRIIFFCFLVVLSIGTLLLFPSFSNPNLTSSSLVLPFSKSFSFTPTEINCQINNSILDNFRVTEASFYTMEQAEGIFAKVLNMSLEDGDGKLFALSLTDMENSEKDSCLTINSFYGIEHRNSIQNFSHDIGTTVFSNSSSLIFENKNGDSAISRNGWIKVNRCEKGIISGDFSFILKGEETDKSIEGEFINVLLEIE